MQDQRQTTIGDIVKLDGVGVHTGKPVSITLVPADAGQGVVFIRTDLGDEVVEAHFSNVGATELCTVIGDPRGASVGTVEHLMSALAGLGVDNVTIEIDGPEVPIMDGSAAVFVAAIDKVKVVPLRRRRRQIRVLKSVRVESGPAFAELHPSSDGFHVDVEIDFEGGVIGRQRSIFEVTPAVFRKEAARARTFGFMRDVERLWKAGLALGASLDNTVAVGEDRVINPEGLRWPDEFSRHKALDAIGDLALAGAPLLGTFRSYRGGHRLNVAILEALFADATAYELVDADDRRTGRDARRDVRRADLVGVMTAPAFAPEVN